MLIKKKFEILFLSILIIYCFYCFLQFGRTWDILFHYELGKDRLDYLFSFGKNKVDNNLLNNKYYPGAYNTILAFLVQIFPRNFTLQSIYSINFFFSVFTLVGISKISRELFNKNIGKITFLICFLNPIFFGHMAMNSIDTIIAFSYIWFLYLIIKYLKNSQNQKKRNGYTLLAALCLGLGVGTRNSFIVTLVPIFIFLFLEIFYFKIFIKKNFNKKIFFLDCMKVLIISYLFMVFFWPQTHVNILLMPLKLAVEGISWGWGAPMVLFNGHTVLTETISKSYILVNLFYKMPEFVIVGFFIMIIFFLQISKYFKKTIKGFNFKILSIILIIIFPNFLILFSPYGFYDGLRLVLYIIPFVSIISSILIYYFFKNIKSQINKISFYFLLILKFFFIINFLSMTPFHYTYLNIFAGKYEENEKKFENDYWGISTKKLVSKFKNFDKNKEIKIATCGIPEGPQEDYLKELKGLKFKMVNKNDDFDYIIMNNRIAWDIGTNLSIPRKIKTCYQKYDGEDVVEIKKRGLIISKITKRN